jgi:hypothetical protein
MVFIIVLLEVSRRYFFPDSTNSSVERYEGRTCGKYGGNWLHNEVTVMPQGAFGRWLPPPPSGAMSLSEISGVIAMGWSRALPQSLLTLCSGVGSREICCLYSLLSPSGQRVNTV